MHQTVVSASVPTSVVKQPTSDVNSASVGKSVCTKLSVGKNSHRRVVDFTTAREQSQRILVVVYPCVVCVKWLGYISYYIYMVVVFKFQGKLGQCTHLNTKVLHPYRLFSMRNIQNNQEMPAGQ